MKTKYIIERINNINIYTSKILKDLEEIKDYIVLDRDNDKERLGIFLNSNENGENRPYKKRYDGKGKRYFGKNKRRYNNSSENE
jgi:hypothetical protein